MKKKKRKIKLGEVTDTVEVKLKGQVIESAETNEAIEEEQSITVTSAMLLASVGAEWSQTFNTGDFTSTRIASSVRVCCENNKDAIEKRAAWCEGFVQSRVDMNSEHLR